MSGEEKGALEEADEGESFAGAHTENISSFHFWTISNSISLQVNQSSPGMEVEDQELKRTTEEIEEVTDSLLSEEGKPAAKLSQQECATKIHPSTKLKYILHLIDCHNTLILII